jgi:hypothetical protein
MTESTRFTPYDGWEDDVLTVASDVDLCFQGVEMATATGMPVAVAAQRLLGAFPGKTKDADVMRELLRDFCRDLNGSATIMESKLAEVYRGIAKHLKEMFDL